LDNILLNIIKKAQKPMSANG